MKNWTGLKKFNPALFVFIFLWFFINQLKILLTNFADIALFFFLSGCRNSDLPINNNRKPRVSSLRREDRCYTTRGSLGLVESGKVMMDHLKEDNRTLVWPKLFITLSSKEKEEDFMTMKGCKPSQRPKKRAKLIQRRILVSLLIK